MALGLRLQDTTSKMAWWIFVLIKWGSWVQSLGQVVHEVIYSDLMEETEKITSEGQINKIELIDMRYPLSMNSKINPPHPVDWIKGSNSKFPG